MNTHVWIFSELLYTAEPATGPLKKHGYRWVLRREGQAIRYTRTLKRARELAIEDARSRKPEAHPFSTEET